MARDNLDRAFAPTVPSDLNDPPRFSQLTETTKDALVVELRKFIDNATIDTDRREELPTVEKYASFAAGTGSPHETVARVLRKHADINEALPHIAVMSSTGTENKLTIGPPLLVSVQDPPRIVATVAGPYVLADGDVLQLRTHPFGVPVQTSNITFTTNRFFTSDPIDNASASAVARVINEQALYVHARVVESGDDSFVHIECGGPFGAKTPNEVEVLTGTDDNVLDVFGLGRRGTAAAIGGTAPNMQLVGATATFTSADIGRQLVISGAEKSYFNDGRFEVTAVNMSGTTATYTNKYGKTDGSFDGEWFIGLRDDSDNTLRPPKHRYGMAWDLSVQLDVLAEDENERGEMTDLMMAFLGFFLERKFFTLMGRTGFEGQTTASESYQVILRSNARVGPETEQPRPGDGSGKIYANTLSFDVTTVMYIDRSVYVPTTDTPFIIHSEDVTSDATLPSMS